MGVGPVEDLDEVLLDEEDPTRVIKVGKELKVEIKARLVEFFKKTRTSLPGHIRTWLEFLHP